MIWYQIFQDGPEYEARKGQSSFAPPNLTLKQVHDAVPKHLFKRSSIKSLYYVFQHLAFSYVFYNLAARIDPFVAFLGENRILGPFGQTVVKTVLWSLYWFWQGIAMAGIWCLGHEAGHDALSDYSFVNTAIGFPLHSFILVPYYSWRITHRTHHKSTNNLDRDETYIPPTRKDIKLPDSKVAVAMDYKELVEETPAFTLFKMFMRQFFGYQLYLLHNRKGNPKYPWFTSHYKPSSLIFKPEHHDEVVLSSVGVGSMLLLLMVYMYQNGFGAAAKYYWIPWLWANNWVVTFTYLQHSDPTIPYYRSEEWTFARGALATVDRPFFGWIGRFFLHNIAHDHVAHHFFSMVPFYNQPMVTEAIKPVLGGYYNYDSSNTFRALWRSFRQCMFVETEGSVVFFKNQQGEAARGPVIGDGSQ